LKSLEEEKETQEIKERDFRFGSSGHASFGAMRLINPNALGVADLHSDIDRIKADSFREGGS